MERETLPHHVLQKSNHPSATSADQKFLLSVRFVSGLFVSGTIHCIAAKVHKSHHLSHINPELGISIVPQALYPLLYNHLKSA